MQNKLNEIKLSKTRYKEALEKQPKENVKQVSDHKIELIVLIHGIEK